MTIDAYDFEANTAAREQWEQKCWGLVRHVFSSPDVAVSILKVEAGFRCSRHVHRTRGNIFFCVSAILKIDEWSESGFRDGHPPFTSILTPGEIRGVAAGRPHCFRVLRSGVVVEIYTPDGGPVEEGDIERYDCGGVDEPA